MSSSDVAALQSAVNRFAAIGGFPKVAVDGFMGPATRQGTYSALAWIGQGKCYQEACAEGEIASTAAGIMADWDETASAAKGIAEFLGNVANDLGIPHAPAPVPGGGGLPVPGGGTLTPLPNPGYAASLVESFKRMPLWQQIALSLLGSVGLIWVVSKISNRRA